MIGCRLCSDLLGIPMVLDSCFFLGGGTKNGWIPDGLVKCRKALWRRLPTGALAVASETVQFGIEMIAEGSPVWQCMALKMKAPVPDVVAETSPKDTLVWQPSLQLQA